MAAKKPTTKPDKVTAMQIITTERPIPGDALAERVAALEVLTAKLVKRFVEQNGGGDPMTFSGMAALNDD